MKWVCILLTLVSTFFVGYKLNTAKTTDIPYVVYNPDKVYHDKFNKEVWNLLQRGCLPSFATRQGDGLHGNFTYDTYVNRWENKVGGYTYFVRSWSDGEERQVRDIDLGAIIPCHIIKHKRWLEPEID